MKRKLTKALALLLAFCMMAVLFAGCGGGSGSGGNAGAGAPSTTGNEGSTGNEANTPAPAQAETTAGSVTVGLEKDGGTLAPFANVNFGNVDVFEGFYQRLCYMNADGSTSNVLMESVEEVDELTYHITIYDNIYDSAGNHITAEDVAFSIDAYINIGNNQGACPDYASATAIDEYVVEWKNATPFGNGMMYKEFSNPRIVSQKAYEESPDGMATDPIGTGPYVVAQYVPGSTLVLEKRDDYWKTDDSLKAISEYANVDKITYSIILDSSQMAMALQAGNIDFAGALNNTDLANFENNPDFNIVEMPGVKPFLLILNATDQSPCQDINLRKAILNGVDNNSIVAAQTEMTYAINCITSKTEADYLSEWDSRTIWSYDPEQAAADLAQSSYNNEELSILCMSGSSVIEACAMVIQSQLNDLGIKVVIDTVDNAQWRSLSADAGAYDLLIMENGGGPYSTQCWNNAWSHANGKTPIDDPELASRLNTAMQTGDKEALIAFQDYIDEMAYGKGMVQPVYQSASTKTIASMAYGTDNKYLINACTFAG